jgi:polyhydroxyalkanoate synthase
MGKNVASTPGKVVFQNEMIQLLQFNPTTKEQWKRPLLIIPPWINKYYILDLRDSNSYIKWATDQGHTVFVISWVNPDAKLAKKGFDDYMTEGAIAAIDVIASRPARRKSTLIGYCLGGTLLGSTMGYMAAKKDKRIASRPSSSPCSTSRIPGELGVFIDEGQVASLEKKMEERGYLEGSEMAGTFNMLRSNDLIWSFVVNNYLMGKEPFPFDLLYWNSDSTRMPYKMHSYYLRNMYINNLLREPGRHHPAGRRRSTCPRSRRRPTSSRPSKTTSHRGRAYLGATALGGPVRFVLGGSGHIAGIVNPPSANKYGFWTNDARPETPDEWFAGAKQHEGSWWTDWQKWITKLNDEKVPARDPAKGKFKPLEDAPGSFVKFRLDAPEKEEEG